MTTGAEVERARKALALVEAGALDFIADIEQSLVNSMAARVLSDTLTPEQALQAWTRLGELRRLRADLQRQARLLAPLSPHHVTIPGDDR
jgi:hypothetical protein